MRMEWYKEGYDVDDEKEFYTIEEYSKLQAENKALREALEECYNGLNYNNVVTRTTRNKMREALNSKDKVVEYDKYGNPKGKE